MQDLACAGARMQPDVFTWDDLRLVLAIAETGGLAPASDRLGVNASTAFRRLGQLEGRLGLKLFERRRTGYATTGAGAEMAALASRMDEEAHGLARRLAGHAATPDGEVRITTNDGLLVNLLTPVFARARQRHPGIRLDVVLTNEALNLSRRDADLAIRVTPEPPETLVGRRLATVAWALYGRRDDPANDPSRIAADGLRGRDWVGLGGGLENVAAARFVRRHAPAERIVYKVSTVLGLDEAVQAGIGIGPLPCHGADRRPDLVRLSPPDPELAGSLWILTHADLRHAPRIRVLMDVLAEEIGRERAALAGETG